MPPGSLVNKLQAFWCDLTLHHACWRVFPCSYWTLFFRQQTTAMHTWMKSGREEVITAAGWSQSPACSWTPSPTRTPAWPQTPSVWTAPTAWRPASPPAPPTTCPGQRKAPWCTHKRLLWKVRRSKYKRRVIFLEDKFEPVRDNQEMFWERHPALPTFSHSYINISKCNNSPCNVFCIYCFVFKGDGGLQVSYHEIIFFIFVCCSVFITSQTIVYFPLIR